jgi:hypothetical protein
VTAGLPGHQPGRRASEAASASVEVMSAGSRPETGRQSACQVTQEMLDEILSVATPMQSATG